jgi:hypothetical protein
MHIGFDISQTGSGKAGCGYFSHALIKAILELEPEHRYSLYPSFGDFYFDSLMPIRSPYKGRDVHYGPRHLSRDTARAFWTGSDAEASLGIPDIIQANNFWCPTQLTSSRLIYTFYDMGFAVDPAWTTETNRLGCFDGVFRSAMAADWVGDYFKGIEDAIFRIVSAFSRRSNSCDLSMFAVRRFICEG